MNFTIKQYDPIEEALRNFVKHNQDPDGSEHTEDELIRLAVHKINTFED